MFVLSRVLSATFLLCALGALSLRAAEPAEPIGYLLQIEDGSDDVDAATANTNIEEAVCVRGERNLEAEDGLPVFPGDVICSGSQRWAVVLSDNSAITLHPSASLKLDSYGYPAQRLPTQVTLTTGDAFFAVAERPQGAPFLVANRASSMKTQGGKYKVFTSFDGTAYVTRVSVVSGTVTLKPHASNSALTDVLIGSMISAVIYTPVKDLTGAQTTLTKGNISKDEAKALLAQSLTYAEINVSKSGVEKIKAFSQNNDGTTFAATLTEKDGRRIKSVTTQKEGKTVLEKITETVGKSTTVVRITELIDNTFKISSVYKNGVGTAILKDPTTKKTLKGVATLLPDGTRIIDVATKDYVRVTDMARGVRLPGGERIVLKERYLPDGSHYWVLTVLKGNSQYGQQKVMSISADGVKTITTQQVIDKGGGIWDVVAGTTRVQIIYPPHYRPPTLPAISTMPPTPSVFNPTAVSQ